jgi:hypothetical protein
VSLVTEDKEIEISNSLKVKDKSWDCTLERNSNKFYLVAVDLPSRNLTILVCIIGSCSLGKIDFVPPP